MKKLLYLWLSLAAISLALSSCTLGTAEDAGSFIEDDTDVRMALKVPSSGGTRAISDSDEETINNIWVLVFNKEDRFVYVRSGLIRRDAGDPYFTAKLTVSADDNDKFRIVAVANAPISLFNELGKAQYKGETYDNIRKAVVCNLPTDTNPQTNATLKANGIPMWGEVDGKVLVNESTGRLSVTLLRAMARVDVITNPNSPPAVDGDGKVTEYIALDNFSLEEAYVYKGNSRICIVPAPGNYNTSTKLATEVTIPDSPAPFGEKRVYMGNANGIMRDPVSGNGIAMVKTIYVAESDINGPQGTGTYADANHTNRMAIVVGGKYDGSNTVTYYRIDFRQSGSISLHDVLRNTNYQFVINHVHAKGHDTPDEAYNSLESRIEANITKWRDSYDKVIFDGQHRLVLSHDKIVVGKEGSAIGEGIYVIVRTTNIDHPLTIENGFETLGYNWYYDIMIAPLGTSWDSELNATVESAYILILAPVGYPAIHPNGTGGDRESYFLIKSGNLEYKLKVFQSSGSWLTVNTANPYPYNGAQQSFSVNSLVAWNSAIPSGSGNNASGSVSPLATLNTDGGPAGAEVPAYFTPYDDTRNNPRLLSTDNVSVTFTDPTGINPPVNTTLVLTSPPIGTAPTVMPAAINLAYTRGSNSTVTIINPSGYIWTLETPTSDTWLRIADTSAGANQADAKAGKGSVVYYAYATEDNPLYTIRESSITFRCAGYPDQIIPVYQAAAPAPRHLAVVDPDFVFSLDGTTQTARIEYDHSWKITDISDTNGNVVTNRSALLARTQTYSGSGSYAYTDLSLDFKDYITGMIPGETPVTKTFTITFADQTTNQTVYVWEVKAEAIPKVFDNGLKVYPVDLIYSYGNWGWYDYSNTVDGTVNAQIPPNNAQVSPPRANSCAALYPQNTWRLPTSSEWEAVCAYIMEKGGPTRFNIPYDGMTSAFYFAANTYGETGINKDKRVEAIYFSYNESTKKLTYGRTIYMKDSKTSNGRGRCVRNF